MIEFSYHGDNDGYLLSFDLPEPNERHIRSIAGRSLALEQVHLDQYGIVLTAPKFVLRTEPVRWTVFWPKVSHLAVDDRIEGDDACRVWSVWNNFWRERAVSALLTEIAEGDIPFDALLGFPRAVFEYPEVTKAVAHAWCEGRLKAPRVGSRDTDPLYQLYAEATWNLIRGRSATWESAIELACADHADLVPDTLCPFSLGEQLRKTFHELFDRHPPTRLTRRPSIPE